MKKSFYVRPVAGERIETEVTLQSEPRGALFGRVCDPEGHAAEGAVVMVFDTEDGHSDRLRLVASQYADENGHFLIAPLEAGHLYVVKVYKNSLKIRQLQLTIDD